MHNSISVNIDLVKNFIKIDNIVFVCARQPWSNQKDQRLAIKNTFNFYTLDATKRRNEINGIRSRLTRRTLFSDIISCLSILRSNRKIKFFFSFSQFRVLRMHQSQMFALQTAILKASMVPRKLRIYARICPTAGSDLPFETILCAF